MICWALRKCPDSTVCAVVKIHDSRVIGSIQTVQLKTLISYIVTSLAMAVPNSRLRPRSARQVNMNLALAEVSEDVPMASMT